MLALISPEVASDLLLTETSRANGAGAVTLKVKSRKEFAEAKGISTKDSDFNAKYLSYIKGYDSLPTVLVEAFRQKGLVISSAGAGTSKDGAVTSGVIRFAAPPKVKEAKADDGEAAKLKEENEKMALQLKELQEQMAALMAASKLA